MGEKCDWFFGSHGCDAAKGHGPLPTHDGGFCSHRCSDHGGMCSEIKPVDEGETAWVIRQWDCNVDNEWDEWREYDAPFQLGSDGLPPSSAGFRASGALGLFFDRSLN